MEMSVHLALTHGSGANTEKRLDNGENRRQGTFSALSDLQAGQLTDDLDRERAQRRHPVANGGA
jgi:hypothetical protein